MNYYETLGVSRNASDDDIRKAYRKLAMQHHPDRGGNEQKFKEIEEAYRTLSDPQKKQMIDMGMDPNQQHRHGGFQQGPFEFHFSHNNFDDVFSQFGFGFGNRAPRNRSFSVNVQIDLEDVLTGKDINAEITESNGNRKNVSIHIPAGVDHGQQIRYEGMGDHAQKNARPGDLIVNILIRDHIVFKRNGANIIYEKTINIWEAILGTNVTIETLDKKSINITIPKGTQPDTILSCRGEGLPIMRSRSRGNLLIKIKVEIPRNLTDKQLQTIEQIKNGF